MISVVRFCFTAGLFGGMVFGEIPTYASLCPYNDFCNDKATKVFKSEAATPCCQPCSCEHDCQMFSNCCPDKVIDEPSQVKYPCVDLTELHNYPRNLTLTLRMDVRFRIVDDCPNSSLDRQYRRCNHPLDIEDFVAVSSKTNDRLYKNKHCALCNGVKEFIYWDLVTDCDQIRLSDFSSFEERDKYLLQHCAIAPFPPFESASRQYRCYKLSLSVAKCNITGVWDNEDILLKNACESKMASKNTLFFQRHNHYWLFQNVYCYICNTKTPHRVSNNCYDLTMEPDAKHPGAFSLFSLLDMYKHDLPPPHHQCLINQIWDPFEETCVTISCQPGKLPYYGECKYTARQSIGFALTMVFEISGFDVSMETLYFFENSINIALGLNDICRQCYTLVNVGVKPHNNNRRYFLYPILTSINCPLDLIIRKMKLILKLENLRYQKNNKITTLNMILNWTISNLDEETRFSMTNKYRGSRYCNTNAVFSQNLITDCPRLSVINPQHGMNEKLINDVRNGSALICVDDYFHFMNRSHNGQCSVNKYAGKQVSQFMCLYVVFVVYCLFTD